MGQFDQSSFTPPPAASPPPTALEAMAALAAALRTQIEFDDPSPSSGRGFGSKALKINGKMFAMLVNNALVLKLPRDQTAGLVDAGGGAYFERGQGGLMRDWVALPGSPDAHLLLALTACAFVRDHGRRKAVVLGSAGSTFDADVAAQARDFDHHVRGSPEARRGTIWLGPARQAAPGAPMFGSSGFPLTLCGSRLGQPPFGA